MLRVLLLRHAKSDRPAGVIDLDRPLNPRGRRNAPLMAGYLVTENLRPDHVAVSPARRTRETWEPVQAALGAPDATIVPDIYEAPDSALLKVVRATPDSARCLLVVGHNPGLQDVALRLVGSGPAAARDRLAEGFPTGALAVLDFDVETWAKVRAGAGRLERFVAPRDLDADEAA
ncbi:phosphoglycerate mutase [Methylobacterium sp. Leaf102]|jgi:phosphohistidine phosphatase|uniref:SixA phosphatase family protein n=1 Tax=unclassified Methylobacterium TaxID=2615210 RepID=UPI0006F46CC8|nr:MULTISPECIES: histidine phosphatase family protein [unclassified Methylobacterium]KQO71764.1 phosphoglycerate mutase [Methylobacterium sp. Leaf87]KQP33344.1 phosphoglycerate mutase [Methylobacterium sp. Leaf102]USU32281.1 histidine phosphatase family protein [Methylobacterium sp. OTU13CASTA1]